MLDKDIQIKELYSLSHKHDSTDHLGYDYKNNMLSRTLSPVLFRNEKNQAFLSKVQDLMTIMYESNLVLRNLFNVSVDKYYDGHTN